MHWIWSNPYLFESCFSDLDANSMLKLMHYCTYSNWIRCLWGHVFKFVSQLVLNLIKSLSVQTLLLACDASSFVSIGALLHIFESIKFNVRIEFNFIAQHALNLIKILIYSNLSSIVMPTHCLNCHHHIASNHIHCLYESYSNFLHENH